MSFGLAGSAGSGKTTLAKEIAEAMHIHYHDASVTRIMKAAGINPVAPGVDLDTRIEAQEFLLRHYEAELRQLPSPFITDRTPLDMAAYMLGELTMTNATPAQGQRAAHYVEDCLNVTREFFDAILAVRPLPFYEIKGTRPPLSRGYQWQTQLLVEGAMQRLNEKRGSFVYHGVLKTPDRKLRLEASVSFFADRIQQWQNVRAQTGSH